MLVVCSLLSPQELLALAATLNMAARRGCGRRLSLHGTLARMVRRLVGRFRRAPSAARARSPDSFGRLLQRARKGGGQERSAVRVRVRGGSEETPGTSVECGVNWWLLCFVAVLCVRICVCVCACVVCVCAGVWCAWFMVWGARIREGVRKDVAINPIHRS